MIRIPYAYIVCDACLGLASASPQPIGSGGEVSGEGLATLEAPGQCARGDPGIPRRRH